MKHKLYMEHNRSVIIALKKLPFIPDILGVKVFCFSSPSFLKMQAFISSNKYGKIEIPKRIETVHPIFLVCIIPIILQ